MTLSTVIAVVFFTGMFLLGCLSAHRGAPEDGCTTGTDILRFHHLVGELIIVVVDNSFTDEGRDTIKRVLCSIHDKVPPATRVVVDDFESVPLGQLTAISSLRRINCGIWEAARHYPHRTLLLSSHWTDAKTREVMACLRFLPGSLDVIHFGARPLTDDASAELPNLLAGFGLSLENPDLDSLNAETRAQLAETLAAEQTREHVKAYDPLLNMGPTMRRGGICFAELRDGKVCEESFLEALLVSLSSRSKQIMQIASVDFDSVEWLSRHKECRAEQDQVALGAWRAAQRASAQQRSALPPTIIILDADSYEEPELLIERRQTISHVDALLNEIGYLPRVLFFCGGELVGTWPRSHVPLNLQLTLHLISPLSPGRVVVAMRDFPMDQDQLDLMASSPVPLKVALQDFADEEAYTQAGICFTNIYPAENSSPEAFADAIVSAVHL